MAGSHSVECRGWGQPAVGTGEARVLCSIAWEGGCRQRQMALARQQPRQQPTSMRMVWRPSKDARAWLRLLCGRCTSMTWQGGRTAEHEGGLGRDGGLGATGGATWNCQLIHRRVK